MIWNQYGGEFQEGGEFKIASSKTPALQAIQDFAYSTRELKLDSAEKIIISNLIRTMVVFSIPMRMVY